MEYRRRSLWNRIWDNERLDELGREIYVRRIYEGESQSWTEVGHGLVLSLYKGIQWLFGRGPRPIITIESDMVHREDDMVQDGIRYK